MNLFVVLEIAGLSELIAVQLYEPLSITVTRS